uniref:Testis-expressed sequence 9 protein n=1 Tax=Mantoniella antarctica TaxID=81844 RepID=A0A7S0SZ95_9CHLO|mmetsp:Transcript_5301/g.13343  ORF Transcript_5301/g.13343 Transcript_5301/m.13343 type:complete len:369 (+) Transcript_5301:179-1285(+)
MADLAQYEQELLRRNAALEERAAASVARAKAVVDGSDAAAVAFKAQAGVERTTEVEEGIHEGVPYVHAISGGGVGLHAGMNYGQTVFGDAGDVGFNAPPTPPQEPPQTAAAAAVAAQAPRPASRTAATRPSSRAAAAQGSIATDEPFAAKEPARTSNASTAPVTQDWEDNAGRLAKARIRALQDELGAQGRELREAHSRLKDRDGELKSLLQDKLAAAKLSKGLQASIEKEKHAAAAARVSAEARERECAELRRESERASRGAKSGEQEMKARDVRLNRALEEVERYRHQLEAARDASKGGDAGARQEAERLAGENKRLERQKTELVAAFKKQMKLIDVLKKQKIHMEAARMLQFAEEDFMKTLDAHN